MRHKGLLLGALALVALLAAALGWQQTHRAGTARVIVPGGDGGGLPLAAPGDEHIDAEALERASHDPSAAGLSAFIVMRHGHAVFERFGHGIDANSVIDSGPMAQVLVALLGGIALRDRILAPSVLSDFIPAHWRDAIERGSGQRYADYLSHKLWARLNATPAWIELPAVGAATPADCCFHARVLDWLRVAGLLTADGNFEGRQVVARGWVAHMRQGASSDGRRGLGLELAPQTPGVASFAAADMFFLRGPGHWRLWLAPSLQLAVLFGAAEAAPSAAGQPGGAQHEPLWDETLLPNRVIEAVLDRPASQKSESLLQQLVPHH